MGNIRKPVAEVVTSNTHKETLDVNVEEHHPKAELPTSTDFPYFIRKSNKNTEVRIGVEKYAFWKIP